jgi:hypothetical protein
VGWVHASDLGWGRRPKLHGMQGVAAMIDLAVPDRPIRPLVRRIEAPQASATNGTESSVRAGSVRTGTTGHERSPTVTKGQEKPQVGRRPA